MGKRVSLFDRQLISFIINNVHSIDPCFSLIDSAGACYDEEFRRMKTCLGVSGVDQTILVFQKGAKRYDALVIGISL